VRGAVSGGYCSGCRQVVAHPAPAFRERHAALHQYREEGGLAARGARYSANCAALVDGLRQLGLRPFLPTEVQAPIIVTFHAPDDPAYDFKAFYQLVRDRGFILYPGKLTEVETFRVGCIGAISTCEIEQVVEAIRLSLNEMELAIRK